MYTDVAVWDMAQPEEEEMRQEHCRRSSNIRRLLYAEGQISNQPFFKFQRRKWHGWPSSIQMAGPEYFTKSGISGQHNDTHCEVMNTVKCRGKTW